MDKLLEMPVLQRHLVVEYFTDISSRERERSVRQARMKKHEGGSDSLQIKHLYLTR